MKKGFTVVELLVVVSIIAVVAGVIITCVQKKNAEPEVITVQQSGKLEANQTRVITKVPESKLAAFLGDIPAETKIVQVIPVYRGYGNSFDLSHYIVITEK